MGKYKKLRGQLAEQQKEPTWWGKVLAEKDTLRGKKMEEVAELMGQIAADKQKLEAKISELNLKKASCEQFLLEGLQNLDQDQARYKAGLVSIKDQIIITAKDIPKAIKWLQSRKKGEFVVKSIHGNCNQWIKDEILLKGKKAPSEKDGFVILHNTGITFTPTKEKAA